MKTIGCGISTNTPIGDDNWAVGSPDENLNNDKDCLALKSNESLWFDTSCVEKQRKIAFICMKASEYQTTESTTTPTPTTQFFSTPTQPPVECALGWTKFMDSCYKLEKGQLV